MTALPLPDSWLPVRLIGSPELTWEPADISEVNPLLRAHHYLGPISGGRHVLAGFIDGSAVAAMVWRTPTSRYFPADGSWLELSRWCLTPEAGLYAGSRMHAFAARYLKAREPALTTLVSYSDPSAGHTGALYKACNWLWAPTWHRLRPPPSGNGNWGNGRQAIKDRWIFKVRGDQQRAELLMIKDDAIVRKLRAS